MLVRFKQRDCEAAIYVYETAAVRAIKYYRENRQTHIWCNVTPNID